MKISSGIYKGKQLFVPKTGVKPTADRVRQAVMNILQGEIKGASFLDLYCGTGAVGIEALSQGARFSCFVESSEKMYRILKKNLEQIVPEKKFYKTVRHHAINLTPDLIGTENIPFDIIFADPFYRDTGYSMDDLYKNVMSLLKEEGIFILEHGSKENFSEYPFFINNKTYGDTELSLFRKTQEKL